MSMIKKKQKCKGIAMILLAGFFFAGMTFFVRLSGDLPTMQKAFFRNAVAALAAVIMLMRTEEKFHIHEGCAHDLFMRSLCGTLGLICNFYAIDKMPISDANMLNKLSPFFAIIMSTFLLKERASKTEWGFVVAAFTGSLLVIKPSFSAEFVYALIGMLGGLGAGIAYTYVRRLGIRGERGPVIVMCFSLFSCLVSLPFVILNYRPMTMDQLLCLLLAGVCATGGQFSITAAYTFAPAKEISVFDYSQVVFAALLGYLFLGQLADSLSYLGYLVIIGTAVAKWIYTMKKE